MGFTAMLHISSVPLLVVIGDNAVRAFFKEGADCGIEILDVSFGPFNL